MARALQTFSAKEATMEDPRRLIVRLAVAVAAADGRLSGEEMHALERLDEAGFGPLSALALQEIERAAREPIDIRATCAALRSIGPQAVALVFSALADVAESDGVSQAELDLLRSIAVLLEVPPAHATGILARGSEPAASSSPRRPVTQPTQPVPSSEAPTESEELTRARALLGIDQGADRRALDAAYLALVERYDPGKVTAFGPEFVVLAVRRLADITAAYEAMLETGMKVEPEGEEDLQ
jgi:uncharacterized tellurite resistance protein B-like protein